MRPVIHNGWLKLPYSGPDAVLVEIGTGRNLETVEWRPAFLDYHDGQRVAQVRAPGPQPPRTPVWLRSSSTGTVNAGMYPST